jgi:nitrate reductase assembly molybdenum cofactor insertion protein NarJ
MSRIQIVHNGEDTPFSKPIKRALLRDARLSYGARGLFAMLWDFPSDWIFYSSHIVGMSPSGMTQLKNYLKELKTIGAIKIFPKQLSREEAVELTKISTKKYRAGQITGKQWVLNNPDLWAIGASLSNANNKDSKGSPKDRFSTSRQNQSSVKPTNGKSTAKGLRLKGLAINEEPLPLVIAKTLDAIINCSKVDYFYPKQLTQKERDLAKRLLAHIDQQIGQEILDELAARLNTNSIKSYPLAYMRSLITRAQQNLFAPEAGMQISHARVKASAEKAKTQYRNITITDAKDIPKYLSAMHKVLGDKQPPEMQE